jgi:GTP-binding protein HflX
VAGVSTDDTPPDLSEIAELAAAGGYTVVERVGQRREEDPAYHLGEGKVTAIGRLLAEHGAGTLIIDARLGPYQVFNIARRCPPETVVKDRFTLILDIFADRAQTKTAQLQVALARLRYELPRVEAKASLASRDERPGFMGLGEYDEGRKQDITHRIARLERQLTQLGRQQARRRERRREAGFWLVAMAGYTNAGKSTLLRRLAADLEVDANEGLHPDLDPTAESRDELFTTLGTTSRRVETPHRQLILTDTVGFVAELPPWLVESFRSTLEAAYKADLLLLVVDASDPVETIRRKISVSHATLSDKNEAPILTVLTKADQVAPARLRRVEAELGPLVTDPVAVSGETGMGIEALLARIDAMLPAAMTDRVILPQSPDAMEVVSWIYDHADVEAAEHTPESIAVTYRADRVTVARTRAKLTQLGDAEQVLEG